MCADASTESIIVLQKSLQPFDHLKDEARIYRERALHARRIINQSVVERYSKGELALILDFHFIGKINVIRRVSGDCPGIAANCLSGLILHLNAANVGVLNHRYEKPMFISLVENVNGPDGEIPSFVRLYFVNHKAEKVGTGDVYFSPSQRVFKLFPRTINGELGKLAEGPRSDSCNSFHPSIVEGAFEIMSDVTYQQCCGNLEPPVSHIMLNRFVSKLRINLDARNVVVWQTCEPSLQLHDVLIGPIDFQP